jgi:hypothetical protein
MFTPPLLSEQPDTSSLGKPVWRLRNCEHRAPLYRLLSNTMHVNTTHTVTLLAPHTAVLILQRRVVLTYTLLDNKDTVYGDLMSTATIKPTHVSTYSAGYFCPILPTSGVYTYTFTSSQYQNFKDNCPMTAELTPAHRQTDGREALFVTTQTRLKRQPIGPIFKVPIGYAETSVTNHQRTLRNIPEERRSHLHRGKSLRSRRVFTCHEGTTTPVHSLR